jgi:pilus assembly protein Flp/PilA
MGYRTLLSVHHSTPFASRQFGNRSRSEDHMKNLLVRFISEDQGQDLIEYGLLIAIITTGAIVSINAIGPKVASYFATLNTQLPAAP